MASWAEIDENNIVFRVLVTDNDDQRGDEGYSWLVENLGGRWIQTSVHANFRKNFAGIGYTYDEERDAFIPPQPFASWTLDEDTCNWVAPTPNPGDAWSHYWDEESLSWKETN